jgi:hypothetical protein
MALPPDRVALPRSTAVVVSKKSTLPVGVPAPGALALTVAVKVTVCPRLEEFVEAPAAVVDASFVTVCVREPWLGEKSPSPL